MRTKIIAGNLLILLVVCLASFTMVKSGVEGELVGEVDARISSDFELASRSLALQGRELAELVEEQAASRPVRDVFGALDESGRRRRAFEAAQRVSTWLGDPARGRRGRPDIIAIVDDHGRVVARDSDVNALVGTDLSAQIAAIPAALRGTSATGVWEATHENKVLQVVVAPIRGEQSEVLGAMVVGYDLSNGLASSEGSTLGRDVAFVWGDRVYSSSLDGTAPADLGTYLFGPGAAATTAARDSGAVSSPFVVQLGASERIAVVGPIPSSQAHVALVVMADRTAQLNKASSTQMILIMMVVGALLMIGYGFFLGTTTLNTISRMEEGLLQVMNGRLDLRLEVDNADLGGLAYRINQLLNVLTSTEEVDESGAIAAGSAGGGWADAKAEAHEGGSSEGDGADPELVARLSAEPEETYYHRVYTEYAAAKQAAGEDVSNITEEKFVQRLKANEQTLMKKHGCRMVRFQVQTLGSQVNLTPVIIR